MFECNVFVSVCCILILQMYFYVQLVVERMLASEGIKRVDLGREEFTKRVWEWKEKYVYFNLVSSCT